MFDSGTWNSPLDGDGTCSLSEIRHVLHTLGEKMTDEEVDLFLSEIPEAHQSQGRIRYAEFVNLIMQ